MKAEDEKRRSWGTDQEQLIKSDLNFIFPPPVRIGVAVATCSCTVLSRVTSESYVQYGTHTGVSEVDIHGLLLLLLLLLLLPLPPLPPLLLPPLLGAMRTM